MFFLTSSKKASNAAKPLTRFFCPRCDDLRLYDLRAASLDFTFYHVPLFDITILNEFVVCRVCKKGFDPQVLAPGNQSLFRLAWLAKLELCHLSTDDLKELLLGKGFKQALIDQVLFLAQN